MNPPTREDDNRQKRIPSLHTPVAVNRVQRHRRGNDTGLGLSCLRIRRETYHINDGVMERKQGRDARRPNWNVVPLVGVLDAEKKPWVIVS